MSETEDKKPRPETESDAEVEFEAAAEDDVEAAEDDDVARLTARKLF